MVRTASYRLVEFAARRSSTVIVSLRDARVPAAFVEHAAASARKRRTRSGDLRMGMGMAARGPGWRRAGGTTNVAIRRTFATPRGLRGGERQREGAARAGLAADGQVAPHPAREVAADGEPQPRPLVGAGEVRAH